VTDPIRVLVVDDHAVVREGLRAFLELQDGIDDPAPDRHAGGVTNRPELVGPSDAFHLGRVSVALEHQAGNAPNIDFGYHAAETARSRSINA